MSPAKLKKYEPSIVTAADEKEAYLAAAASTGAEANGYRWSFRERQRRPRSRIEREAVTGEIRQESGICSESQAPAARRGEW